RAYRTRNCLSGTFQRWDTAHIIPPRGLPVSPMPYRIQRAATPSVRTHEGEVGRPPATSPPETSHRRRDAAPREAPPPGEAATSSRTGGRRPSPQREGSWRPAPICKVRTPVRPFLLDLLFLLLDSHFLFLISRFHDFIQ